MGKKTEIQNQHNRKERSIRNFKRGVLSLSAAVLLGGGVYFAKPFIEKKLAVPVYETNLVKEQPYHSVKTAISFEEARINSSLRDKYLEQLVNSSEIPGCQTVIYNNDGVKMGMFMSGFSKEIPKAEVISVASQLAGNYVCETFIVMEAMGKKISVPIFVGRNAFNVCKNGDDLRASILYNEGSHTRQMYFGSEFYSSDEVLSSRMELLKCVNELESSLNTFVAVSKYNIPVSVGFSKMDEEDYADYYKQLSEFSPANETEKNIRKRALDKLPKIETILKFSSK